MVLHLIVRLCSKMVGGIAAGATRIDVPAKLLLHDDVEIRSHPSFWLPGTIS